MGAGGGFNGCRITPGGSVLASGGVAIADGASVAAAAPGRMSPRVFCAVVPAGAVAALAVSGERSAPGDGGAASIGAFTAGVTGTLASLGEVPSRVPHHSALQSSSAMSRKVLSAIFAI